MDFEAFSHVAYSETLSILFMYVSQCKSNFFENVES